MVFTVAIVVVVVDGPKSDRSVLIWKSRLVSGGSRPWALLAVLGSSKFHQLSLFINRAGIFNKGTLMTTSRVEEERCNKELREIKSSKGL